MTFCSKLLQGCAPQALKTAPPWSPGYTKMSVGVPPHACGACMTDRYMSEQTCSTPLYKKKVTAVSYKLRELDESPAHARALRLPVENLCSESPEPVYLNNLFVTSLLCKCWAGAVQSKAQTGQHDVKTPSSTVSNSQRFRRSSINAHTGFGGRCFRKLLNDSDKVIKRDLTFSMPVCLFEN